jgi:hypothetical protein
MRSSRRGHRGLRVPSTLLAMPAVVASLAAAALPAAPALTALPALTAVTARLAGAANLAAAAEPPGTAQPGRRRLDLLDLVDDRGQAIASPLEACFQVELRTDCKQVVPGEKVRLPAAFHSLRLEGPGHGPLDLARAELLARVAAAPKAGGEPAGRLAVPRKAVLHIVGLNAPSGHPPMRQQPLTVSLYRPRDPAFREPAYRATLAPGESSVNVPAGELIVSLAMAGNAPDLKRLKARPGEPVHLTYQPRPGWSLVARLRAAADDRPVSGVRVKLAEIVGFGRPGKAIAESVSGLDGLVLFPGLTAAMAELAALHPDFLAADAPGLTASPGTFAFREVALQAGGRLRAQISVHGRPVQEATCELHSPVQMSPDSKEPYRQLWEGKVDAQGICRSTRLAAGVYKLRVLMPQSASRFSRWVTVPEGRDADVDVPLAPARVAGLVKRGGSPVPGYRVKASRLEADRPPGAPSEPDSEAVSDEAGRYSLTLWSPGTYILGLRSPSGTPVVGHRQLTSAGDDEQTVDFDLAGSPLRGTVTDEAGQPVQEAKVALQGSDGVQLAASDGAGRFEFDLQGKDAATLRAFKIGYREADPVDVQALREDVPVPPVTLVLKRRTTARGTVLSAVGAPVADALVISIASTRDGPDAYRATRSGADGSFEVEVPPGAPPRVFVSGPGCPLSGFDLPALPAPPAATLPAPAGDVAEAAEPESAAAPAMLRCPASPAALLLSLADDRGTPLAHAGLILRTGSTVVPHAVLVEHLVQLGLAPETDGGGNLILAGLAPGDYDLFLNLRSSEATVAAGSHEGFLTSVTLPALETTDIQLTLRQER